MKMNAPEGATSCSFDGRTFEVKNGVVSVPDQAAVALLGHGFTPNGKPDDPAVAEELKKFQSGVDAKERLEKAVIVQQIAQGKATAAKASGDVMQLTSALAEVSAANTEVEAARAASLVS